MNLVCPTCDATLNAREVETTTRYEHGDFTTRYRCPECGSDYAEIEQLHNQAGP